MPVSDAIRQVEREIDDRLAKLPLWRCARDNVLKAVLDNYRDAHEAILIATATAMSHANEAEFYNINLQIACRIRPFSIISS